MTKGSSRSSCANDTNAASFEEFFEGWLVRQEHYLDELVSAMEYCHESHDDDIRDLTNRVFSHYQQYYEEKSRLAQRNIFLLFCPPWFTSFERTFLWITGFKPAMAFGIVHDAVHDMSAEQVERMNRLTDETRIEERMLNDELARIQESTASPPLLQLARMRGRLGTNGDGAELAGLETLRSGLEAVVASADMLRTNTVMKVVEILNPVQTLAFATAATRLQLKLRRLGLQNESAGHFGRYGLVWVSTTLVFALASLGNCATYLMDKRTSSGSSWKFDVGYINVAAGVIYCYVLIVPLVFYFLLQYLGSNANLVRFWCMWGYSLAIFIPSSFLLLIPVEILRWIVILVVGIDSALFVSTNLKSFIEANDLTIVIVTTFLLQLALAIFIKAWFFP